jgi:hypothetical protein
MKSKCGLLTKQRNPGLTVVSQNSPLLQRLQQLHLRVPRLSAKKNAEEIVLPGTAEKLRNPDVAATEQQHALSEQMN